MNIKTKRFLSINVPWFVGVAVVAGTAFYGYGQLMWFVFNG